MKDEPSRPHIIKYTDCFFCQNAQEQTDWYDGQVEDCAVVTIHGSGDLTKWYVMR